MNYLVLFLMDDFVNSNFYKFLPKKQKASLYIFIIKSELRFQNTFSKKISVMSDSKEGFSLNFMA